MSSHPDVRTAVTPPFKVSRYSGKGTVMPEETVLIQPLPVQRGKGGNWTHPQLPEFGENCGFEPIRIWLESQNLDWKMIPLEDDMPADDYAKWLAKDEYDAEGWEPTKPDGEGWFVLSIHDTEESPVCWWARRVMP
jgi:hypothetical protein